MEISELQSRFLRVVTAAADLLDSVPAAARNETLPQAYNEFQKHCQLLLLQIENAEKALMQQADAAKSGANQSSPAAQELHGIVTQLAQDIQGGSLS